MSMLQESASGDFKTLMATLPKLIISWNFVDEEGEYIGDPSEVTIAKLPTNDYGRAEQITDKIGNAVAKFLDSYPVRSDGDNELQYRSL